MMQPCYPYLVDFKVGQTFGERHLLFDLKQMPEHGQTFFENRSTGKT